MDGEQHILVVDDDDRLRRLLHRYLTENGFRVTAAADAADARAKMNSIAFDLVVLDRMMPGENGIDFAQSLRVTSSIPILMLTAMAESGDRIGGLEAGADDYLTKPYEPRELLLRINNILRRLPAEPDETPTEARLGDVVFDIAREQLHRGAEHIPLTSTECRLLKLLAERPGAVFAREALLRIVAPGGGTRTVDVQVNRLRQKIEPDPKIPRYLQTVRGQGYILRTD
ncbi:MAG: response regulator transcription factor [Rhodospirillales bacterium]|jgi:two-component system phosphate regulon response regulator OmpR